MCLLQYKCYYKYYWQYGSTLCAYYNISVTISTCRLLNFFIISYILFYNYKHYHLSLSVHTLVSSFQFFKIFLGRTLGHLLTFMNPFEICLLFSRQVIVTVDILMRLESFFFEPFSVKTDRVTQWTEINTLYQGRIYALDYTPRFNYIYDHNNTIPHDSITFTIIIIPLYMYCTNNN